MKLYRAQVWEYNGRVWQTEDTDKEAIEAWLCRTVLRLSFMEERQAISLPEIRVRFTWQDTEPVMQHA